MQFVATLAKQGVVTQAPGREQCHSLEVYLCGTVSTARLERWLCYRVVSVTTDGPRRPCFHSTIPGKVDMDSPSRTSAVPNSRVGFSEMRCSLYCTSIRERHSKGPVPSPSLFGTYFVAVACGSSGRISITNRTSNDVNLRDQFYRVCRTRNYFTITHNRHSYVHLTQLHYHYQHSTQLI